MRKLDASFSINVRKGWDDRAVRQCREEPAGKGSRRSPMRPRITRGFTAAVVGVLSVALAAPALAAPKPDVPKLNGIAIGDSVMLGAKYELQRRGFDVVDAAESRQAAAGPGLVRKRGAKAPYNVVVHLGSNGTYTRAMCRELVETAGPSRRIFLVTLKVPRSYEAANNRMIRSCAASFSPDRVKVVDWNWAASRNPGWLYADGIHLRPEGARAFARIMRNAINKADETEQFASLERPFRPL